MQPTACSAGRYPTHRGDRASTEIAEILREDLIEEFTLAHAREITDWAMRGMRLQCRASLLDCEPARRESFNDE
jgi:hypothetical protein